MCLCVDGETVFLFGFSLLFGRLLIGQLLISPPVAFDGLHLCFHTLVYVWTRPKNL